MDRPPPKRASPQPAGTESTAAVRSPALGLDGAGVSFGPRFVWRHASLEVARGEFVVVPDPTAPARPRCCASCSASTRSPRAASRFSAGPRVEAAMPSATCPSAAPSTPTSTCAPATWWRWGWTGAAGGPLPGEGPRRKRALVGEALEAVGASGYADRAVGRLSGGEQQRLLLAHALVTQPRILLLDEPLASLDIRSQGVISSLVATVARERGITVVLVAHDVNPLVPFVDTVVYLARGRMVSGRTEEVITGETLSDLYEYPVEVLRDSRGRIVVVGLDDCESHHG